MSSRTRTNIKQAAFSARNKRAATSAVDSLRMHENMAALMPAVMRMAAIQRDCKAILPDMFGSCTVLRLDSDRLVLSAPNAAMAARLKQKLPNLQDALIVAGWQVSAIQLKVQPNANRSEPRRVEKDGLPEKAVAAFSALASAIGESPRDEALRSAVQTLVQRHSR